MKKRLLRIYNRLFRSLGPQGWWPAEDAFEVIIGAILTQNTAWANVEKAIRNIKEKGLMSPEALYALPFEELEFLIRPAGYYRVKAARLKPLLEYIVVKHKGNLEAMFKQPMESLREDLLNLHGIGEETADSILLYAGGYPIFVVDAYTKRILIRHGLVRGNAPYKEVQALFMENLPMEAKLFNEFHALLVATGKRFCRKNPSCADCPLKKDLDRALT